MNVTESWLVFWGFFFFALVLFKREVMLILIGRSLKKAKPQQESSKNWTEIKLQVILLPLTH